jgi:hypothetical protein
MTIRCRKRGRRPHTGPQIVHARWRGPVVHDWATPAHYLALLRGDAGGAAHPTLVTADLHDV